MKNTLYGQIDLTKIAKLLQLHPALMHEATFQDGQHWMLNVSISDLEKTDKYGNTHAIIASCKKDDRVEGANYFLGNLKPSINQEDAAKTEADNDFWNRIANPQ